MSVEYRRELLIRSTITNQKSGGSLPKIVIDIKDKFGQVVQSDDTSVAALALTNSDLSSNFTPIISGTISKISAQGQFVFENIQFTAEPGQNYSKLVC